MATDRLDEVFDLQERFQNHLGFDFSHDGMSTPMRVVYVKDMALALADELHEFLGEIGWKPWATSRHIHEEAAKGELVDLFHFFMNLCLAVNMTPQELYLKYLEKRGVNIARADEGYDGVTGKCPGCKRDFGDIDRARKNTAVASFRVTTEDGTVYCSKLCAGNTWV